MTLRLTVVAFLIQAALGAVVPPVLNPGPPPDVVDTNQGLRPPIVFAGSRFRPMQQRPWMMSTTPSSNVSVVDSGLENSVPAVVIMSSRTTAGMLETMIANTLLRQCRGNAEPVLNFYQCVENTTDLQNVWARMGLNATMLRIKTITLTMMRDSNVTQSRNTIITMSDVDPEDQISSMNDLVQLVSSQAPNLCRSIDGLMNCFDPYLASCFADAEETNEVPSAAGSTTSSTPVAIDQSSDLDSNDNDEQTSDRESRRYDDEGEGDMDFFKVPLLNTHSEVSRFMRQVFQQLCANDATPLQLLVNSVPCLIQTANQDNCRQWDNQVGIVRDMMAQQNVTTASQELCGALRSAAECHLDLTIQSCGSDVANLGRDLYQLYFQSVECASPMGGPTATLRPPFNQAIL